MTWFDCIIFDLLILMCWWLDTLIVWFARLDCLMLDCVICMFSLSVSCSHGLHVWTLYWFVLHGLIFHLYYYFWYLISMVPCFQWVMSNGVCINMFSNQKLFSQYFHEFKLFKFIQYWCCKYFNTYKLSLVYLFNSVYSYCLWILMNFYEFFRILMNFYEFYEFLWILWIFMNYISFCIQKEKAIKFIKIHKNSQNS